MGSKFNEIENICLFYGENSLLDDEILNWLIIFYNDDLLLIRYLANLKIYHF